MIVAKTSSLGNVFLHVNAADVASGVDRSRLSRQLCRSGGPAGGGDGVVFFRIAAKAVDFAIFNRDGSEAELSGNGMAGLAALLFRRGCFAKKVILNTRVGKRSIELLDRRGHRFRLKVEIGRADFDDRRLFPFLKAGQSAYDFDGIRFYPVSVGNPHAVIILGNKPKLTDALALGRKVESAPLFPFRTNVELVRRRGPDRVAVVFYERGVGQTSFSSTGSAAVYAVLRRQRMIGDRLTIALGRDEIVVSGKRIVTIDNRTRFIGQWEYTP